MDCFSGVIGLFYTVIGFLCLYCMLTGKTIYSPFSEDIIAQAFPEEKVVRLDLFNSHPNKSGGIFLIPFCLMIYQLFHCKNKLWCIPIAAVMMEFYLCIGLTYSRSCMASASICISLAVIALVLNLVPKEKKTTRILSVILLGFLVTSFFYMSFSWSTGLLGKAADLYPYEKTVTEKTDGSEGENEEQGDAKEQSTTQKQQSLPKAFVDNRNLGEQIKTLNGRTRLFQAILVAYREEPLCMLLGSNDNNMLRYADQIRYGKQYHEGLSYYSHMHNFLLQVLMMTGIPGFLIVLAFCVLLLIHMIRLFFFEKTSLPETVMVCPIAGLFVHFMLEAGLFTEIDVRSMFFFLMAGFLVGIDSERK